ncbi:glycosyltransferase family 4 protein [Lacinutrix sp. MedPE-SW]|uniref:glycosyltransferase family 4 protein n=1 Tax=Lacinutrix sp. MedPE-SW TaxID=1860087 RepID=UPI00091AE4B9|nr:glycosyltransferase family 4 protein [Lacinutrix sp. MedPE-SW]OIQ22713.1 MAG: group 1 glycosyl transferase [Lacinutrix sp. MedPE-SW]
MVVKQHIAIVCNYQLLENRIGGMDYFFWAFNNKCKTEQIIIDWFFPNTVSYGQYDAFKIIADKDQSIEATFINYIKTTPTNYTHVITHFVELCTSFYAEVKHLLNTKIIAVDHNPRPLGGYPLLKQIKKKIKGRLYGKHIDEFIGVSDYTSNAIINDFGRFLKPKTKTIYNGVLIQDIVPKTSERVKQNPRFLVVSHLRFSKGIQDLIVAVSTLPLPLIKDLKIDVFGEGPYKTELLGLVNKYKLNTVFHFKGSSSSLNTSYQDYDYLLQPTHMECFSLSILESLAANVPVITTPVGGNEEVITHGKNGYIFEAEDIQTLSVLLQSVITGKKTIQENTRPMISHYFSIDLMVDNHLSLLQ